MVVGPAHDRRERLECLLRVQGLLHTWVAVEEMGNACSVFKVFCIPGVEKMGNACSVFKVFCMPGLRSRRWGMLVSCSRSSAYLGCDREDGECLLRVQGLLHVWVAVEKMGNACPVFKVLCTPGLRSRRWGMLAPCSRSSAYLGSAWKDGYVFEKVGMFWIRSTQCTPPEKIKIHHDLN